MTATSLPGTIESHSPPTNPGRSSRSGLTSTNSAPRSRAAPAVRAAVDARPPVLIVDAPQLPPQQAHGHRPADRHERLSAAALVRARAPVEPAGTDHRLRDPGRVPEAVDDVAEERRGI